MSPTVPLVSALLLLSACHARLGLTSTSSPATPPSSTGEPTRSDSRTSNVPASGFDPTSEPTTEPASTGDGPVDGAGPGVSLTMENVYGARRADAEKTLRDSGMRGPIVTEVVTEQWLEPVDFKRACVCSQSPEPRERTTTDRRVVLSYCDPDRLPRPGWRTNPTILTGYTVEEAKRRARHAGYAGRIEVVPMSSFDADCKPATVCRLNPLRWESNGPGLLTLYIARQLTISTPN
jgi:hypothetical protein